MNETVMPELTELFDALTRWGAQGCATEYGVGIDKVLDWITQIARARLPHHEGTTPPWEVWRVSRPMCRLLGLKSTTLSTRAKREDWPQYTRRQVGMAYEYRIEAGCDPFVPAGDLDDLEQLRMMLTHTQRRRELLEREVEKLHGQLVLERERVKLLTEVSDSDARGRLSHNAELWSVLANLDRRLSSLEK